MLTLQRLDHKMLLGGLEEIGGIRPLEAFPEDVAMLFHPSMHRTIRLSVTKTFLNTMVSIIKALETRGPNSEPPIVLRAAVATKYVLSLSNPSYLNAYLFALVLA